jgi:hypothetical protein
MCNVTASTNARVSMTAKRPPMPVRDMVPAKDKAL